MTGPSSAWLLLTVLTAIASCSSIQGRDCEASAGYAGRCQTREDCDRVSFSFSRSCGFVMVCCKEALTSHSGNAISLPSNSRKIPGSFGSSSQCGTESGGFSRKLRPRSGRVFGGREARPGQFPFMVSFMVRGKNFCGGVLISGRHVLTAAHCFYNRENPVPRSKWMKAEVRVGVSDLQEERTSTAAGISSVAVHPQYRVFLGGRSGNIHDVSVVTLDRDVTRIPVCLPSLGRRRSNNSSLVLGFGSMTRGDSDQTRLNFAYVKEWSQRECQGKYREARMEGVRITSNMICAGNMETDACAGDSGGPMIYRDSNSRWMVVGVVSFGPTTCGNGLPGVYTRVDRYLSWIRHEMEQ